MCVKCAWVKCDVECVCEVCMGEECDVECFTESTFVNMYTVLS